MNLSGQILESIKNYTGINSLEPQKILVIHDDLDMPLGKVRVKRKSGDGGHNGIKSICYFLNSKDFYRVKVGIGRPNKKEDISNFVLSNFTNNEMVIISKSKILAAKKAIILALSNDLNLAANFL